MKHLFILSVAGLLALPHSPMNSSLYDHERKQGAVGDNAYKSDTVHYTYDSVTTKSTFRFKTNSSAGQDAFARIVFPVFADAKLNQLIRQTILSSFTTKHMFNNSLMATVTLPPSTDPIYQPASVYKNFTNNFIRQFESQTAVESLGAYWYADIKVTVVMNTNDYISCLCKADYFAGGLHDEYDYSYINYDTRAHGMISLPSQLQPGKCSTLSSIAEQIFRNKEHLTPIQDLSNYFFDDDKFELTNNFTITGDGLQLLYTPNEIKPFASGTTELTIPFKLLANIVLPHSVLGNSITLH